MNPSIWFRLVEELHQFRESFIVAPRLWEDYGPPFGLTWNKVDFEPSSKIILPPAKGLYAMTVRARNPDFPPASYLFYVGQVGASGSPDRTFPVRFQDYLNEYSRIKRPKVARFLHKYKGHIDFYYCVLDHSMVDIGALEKKIITALLPMANTSDIEPSISAARRAFS